MSLQYPPRDPYPAPPRREGLGLGAGAALGVLVGLLGPVLIAIGAWGAAGVLPDGGGDVGYATFWAAVLTIITVPALLLLGGCVLVVPDRTRGWGVGALMACGVWLLCSAGVCTVAFFGALASYGGSAMMWS